MGRRGKPLDGSVGCGACGNVVCICARFPDFPMARWEGPARRFDLSKVDPLALGLSEALKPEAPLNYLVAVIRTFVERESRARLLEGRRS